MSKLKTLRKWFLRLLLTLAIFTGLEAMLLRHPSAFFAWSAQRDGYRLYADRPFTPDDAEPILITVRTRVEHSTLYNPKTKHAAFICNSRWRRLLFCIGNYKAGGLNYAPLTTNVFLSGAEIDQNKLISPSGFRVPGEMTLAYFISHEFAHTLTIEHLGVVDYWRMPQWMREGYADLVGRGSVFHRPAARAAYASNAKEMNWPAQAPYLRYNILLGHLLEQDNMVLDAIFRSRMTQAEAEERLSKFMNTQQANQNNT